MTLNVPASGNHWLLTDVLRKDWGSQGIVLSDAFAVGNLTTHGFASNPEDAAYKAITAGANMDMASQTYTNNLARLVTEGKVSEFISERNGLTRCGGEVRSGPLRTPLRG